MNKRDYLIKIVDLGDNVRIYLARTTALAEEAHRRHGTSATASAALGRAMTAAVIMASDFKNREDTLTLRIEGSGPVGVILVTADSSGGVRGLVSNPRADLPATASGKLDVGQLVGKQGYLEVIKDLGLQQPFTGKVPLVSGEIAEDVAHYFLASEQIPALISLGVLVNPDLRVQAAGGLFVQALPGADDQALAMLEHNIMNLGSISSLIDEHETLEDIAALILQGIDHKVVGELDLGFRCHCSRERLLVILAGLPEEEKAEPQNDTIEAECNFCREKYKFTTQEIEAAKKNDKP
ncbi:MAG: Hsp33 family molecular chaperone HslO [Syntrophomonadaceae bacterium]|nr:Hsp33 family molecular chaperone HslO [Syntrophomonadaceae bacterium]